MGLRVAAVSPSGRVSRRAWPGWAARSLGGFAGVSRGESGFQKEFESVLLRKANVNKVSIKSKAILNLMKI